MKAQTQAGTHQPAMAARGSVGTRTWPWGDEYPACWRANFYDNGFCEGDTTQVGAYPSGAS